MQDPLPKQLRKAELVNTDGLRFLEFRKSLTPRWGVLWLQIAAGWLFIIACCTLVANLSGSALWIDACLVLFGSFLIGYGIAYIQLFFHEAAHHNLHPNPVINDFLCNLFVSGIVGQDIRRYRPIHWAHHRYVGTTRDTEISYFAPLNLRFIADSLLGLKVLSVLSLRREKLAEEKSSGSESAGGTGTGVPVLLGGVLANGIFLLTLAYFQQWTVILVWVVGILAWFPFFGALRQLLEHRSTKADVDADYGLIDHGAVHRLFGSGPIASTLGGAGFNRHLLHHWDPKISCTRLGELEDFLMKTDGAEFLRSRQTTYFRTFLTLFRT